MLSRVPCEFALVRYVPDPVRGEFANIGVVLRPVDGDGAAAAAVRFTRDWARVRCMDADADTGLLEAMESELAARVSEARGADGYPKTLLEQMDDSLSNSVQMTPMRACLAESVPAELDLLMRLYVEPMRTAATGRRGTRTGRAAIVGEMRDAFEGAGVWALMRKRIRAAEYTRAGDPLRLDCGYRNGAVRMFQAVSLLNDAEAAKGLAFSAAALRAGVERVEAKPLELTGVVEPLRAADDEEMYRFGVDAMESAGLRVMTTADLGRAAERARLELRG